MKTFIANLRHAIRTGQSVNVGGGVFSPDELKQIVDTLHDVQVTLAATTFAVETAAHLCGMEQELLPTADKARAILKQFEE